MASHEIGAESVVRDAAKMVGAGGKVNLNRKGRARLPHQAQDVFEQSVFRQGVTEDFQMAGDTVLCVERVLHRGLCFAYRESRFVDKGVTRRGKNDALW